jgi:hypothetical protein
MSIEKSFLRRLKRLQASFRLGGGAVLALQVLGYAAVLLTALAAADYFLSFSPPVLVVLEAAALVFLAGVAVLGLWRLGRLSVQRLARRADGDLKSARRDVLSALELVRAEPEAGDLRRYLVERSVDRAMQSMDRMTVRQRLPWPELVRRSRRTLAHLGVAAVALGIPLGISSVVLVRIFHPFDDVPPYSRLRFAVEPASPKVRYGDSTEISVEITGAPVREPVWLLTRHRGRVNRAACFQESATRFTQRLEKLVEPVEFGFATGRARTRWHSLELLLDPHIVAARLKVIPPAYARRPPAEFMAGEAKLAGLKASRVELDLTSNRPLQGGELSVTPGEGGAPRIVRGEPAGPQRLVFRWTLEERAGVEVTLRDAQGTRNREPFRLDQFVLPDEPPAAAMIQPAGFAVATPKAKVPVSGFAEDDLALTRVDLVRTATGFRDRALAVGPEASRERMDFARDLDLAALGVEPGEELEFYLEAVDSNPSMTGVAVSDTVRVQIISEEDYAAMLRSRIDADAFAERFQRARRALADLVDAMKKFKEKAENLSSAERKTSWENLKAKNSETAKLFREMADEFPVFDLEKDFKETLEAAASVMEEHDQWMKEVAFDEGMDRTVASILERLGAQQEAVQQDAMKAEDIAKVARIMMQAQRFRQLLAAQERIVRRLERGGDPAGVRDRELLRQLREQQEDTRRGLIALRDELRDKSKDLPDDLEELRDSAVEFADKIDELEIPPVMEDAAQNAARHESREFHRHASVALDRMRQLLSGDCGNSPFGGMCKGKPRFQVKEALKQTLNQMYGAWCLGMGQGDRGMAGVGGGGGAGNPEDGYWAEGYSSLNVPAYGPSRALSPGQDRTEGSGGGSGGGDVRVDPSAREALQPAAPIDMRRETLSIDHAPAKYRDALKRYFETREGTP